MIKPLLHGALLGLAISGALAGYFYFQNNGLTEAELETARTLSLSSLHPIPGSPSNAYVDNPDAAALGAQLFSDTGLSANGDVACSTCHLADRQFQDDLPLGQGIGTTDRRTMPLAGVGYASWLFWDGRKDSLWSQAIAPLESAVEHGFTRSQVASHITESYRGPYEAVFGALPVAVVTPPASPLGNMAQQAAWDALSLVQQRGINQIFANTGKAIAVFERTLLPIENRFDRYVEAVIAGNAPQGDAVLTQQEIDGFKVFAGKGQCTRCHNGPLLSDAFFHNTGVASSQTPVVDHGRAAAIAVVEADPFNCLGSYSDADPALCGELRFMSRDLHMFERAFKTPSLRGVAARPPYMHAGQLLTLPLVIEHYNRAAPAVGGHTELNSLDLSTGEKAALRAFLEIL